MMEGKETYKNSYEYLQNLCIQNTTGEVYIEYSKLDTESAGQLRKLINQFVSKRKKEVFAVIQKCDCE